MQRGDVTGTKVFKTAIAILWLNLVLEENCTPKHAGVNAHLPFSDFAQLEFFKAKQVTTQGEVRQKLCDDRIKQVGWRPGTASFCPCGSRFWTGWDKHCRSMPTGFGNDVG